MLILVLLKDFISNISKPQSVDQGWRNFIEGFEFSKADFSQGNKKSRMPQAHPTFAEAIKGSMLDITGKCFFHM